MPSFVVQTPSLRQVVAQWRVLVTRHQGENPQGSFTHRSNLFDHLEAAFARIRWFYYNDNDNGVTIRIYDTQFLATYPGDYIEINDDVVLRGYNLGEHTGPLKTAMRQAFTQAISVGSFNDDRLAGGKTTKRNTRTAFFQDSQRNGNDNAPPPNGPNGDGPVQLDQLDTVIALLRQFRQVILYGPPGTGKTRLARRVALALLDVGGSEDPAELDYANLGEDQVQSRLDACGPNRFNLVVFHPAYEYEQFVGGIAPQVGAGGLGYQIEAGVFLQMSRWVEAHSQPAVLIIDEINRGNLPKLLGELVFVLDGEYRGRASVRLPFEWQGRRDLVVPRDLYVIGTMNSSDRSIGHIDVAIRRRFGLVHIEPEPQVVQRFWQDRDSPQFGDQLVALMNRLNGALVQEDRGGELRVGQSYFLANPDLPDLRAQVARKWRHQVHQLLQEYGQLLNLREEFFRRFPEDFAAALLHP